MCNAGLWRCNRCWHDGVAVCAPAQIYVYLSSRLASLKVDDSAAIRRYDAQRTIERVIDSSAGEHLLLQFRARRPIEYVLYSRRQLPGALSGFPLKS